MWKERRLRSQMLLEAHAAAGAVARQLGHDEARHAELGRLLRDRPPATVLTVARGSSDHAAAYCAYLIMARLGRIVASLPMSLRTLYKAPLAADGALAIAISQSGQGPDVIDTMTYLRAAGATTVALVNEAVSPLAQAAQWTLPLHAGTETSVAATKSFIASLVAGARLCGHWADDGNFLRAIGTLPDALEAAAQSDWSAALEVLMPAQRIMVIGRGPGLPIALEAALKFKETCAIQAEAFSSAEVRHGPMALVEQGYPLLLFATRGPAQAGLIGLAHDMRARGARVLLAAPDDIDGRDLTLPVAAHPDLDPIVAIQAFYVMAAGLAAARGMDPDRPRHLSKVTRTS